MNLGGCTTQGPREANEDSFYVLDFSDITTISGGIVSFALVSDGMGGYQGGDVASGITVSCAKRYLEQLVDMAREHQVELDPNAALAEIARNAHESICAEQHRRGNASMGATFVGAFVGKTHAWIGHIGDSRAYLLRDGMAQQLTQDHSHVGRLLSQGVITEQEAQNHPDRNRIERALGFSDGDPEFTEVSLQPGDALLLCSDGVYTVLDAPTLADCVRRSSDADDAAHRVIKKALARNTDDNSTCVVVSDAPAEVGATLQFSQAVSETGTIVAEPAGEALPTAPVKPRSSRMANVLPILLGVALCGGLVGFFLKTGNVQGGAGTAPGLPVASEPQPEADDEGGPKEPAAEAQGEPSTEPGSEGGADTPGAAVPSATYTVGEGATLKYVDADGVAQQFTYERLALGVTLELNVGASVEANTQENSYGRSEFSYRQLADRYLADLLGDVKLYLGGARTFSSELSRMADPDQYLAFVGALAQVDEDTLLREVSHLLLDATVLSGEQQGGSDAANATSGVAEAGATDGAEPGSGATELGADGYGGHPAAGAMDEEQTSDSVG